MYFHAVYYTKLLLISKQTIQPPSHAWATHRRRKKRNFSRAPARQRKHAHGILRRAGSGTQDRVRRYLAVQRRNLQRHRLGGPRVDGLVAAAADIRGVGRKDEPKLPARDVDAGRIVFGQGDVG